MRILVIEDEQHARDYLKAALESEQFAVDTLPDGERGSYAARTNDYDLVILDHILPKKSGLDVCTELRRAGKMMPLLLLSVRSEIAAKTEALDAGADDYMTKPYSHSELLSRIRALLRRSAPPAAKHHTSGTLVLDPDVQEVRIGRSSIYLTNKEFSLLELLLRHKGKVVSRGMIMEHVWNMEGNPFSRTIETHIMNLRRKIRDSKATLIENVPGRGYKICDGA